MGASKKQTIGYRYYLGMHMVLCHGPVDKVVRVDVDDRTAAEGNFIEGPLTIDASGLFGGDSREGGVSGTMDLEFGGSAQGRNDYLQAQLGVDVPAYRGVLGTVLRKMYLGNNPYLKRWGFRAQRIHVRQDGIEQWYNETAEIGTVIKGSTITATTTFEYKIESFIIDTTTQEAIDAIEIPTGGYTDGQAPFGRAAPAGGLDPLVPINTFWGYNTSLWLRKTLFVSETGPVSIGGYVENGAAFYIDGVLVYSVNLDNTQQSNPHGIQYNTVLTLSQGFHTLNILALDEVDEPGTDSENLDSTYFYNDFGAQEVSSSSADMNPAHIIRECLTDPDWGMGYQEVDIDDASFRAAALQLFNEGMGISLLWDRQIKIEEFIQEIVKHIDAIVYVSRTTGKFVLNLIRDDYDENTLLELDPSNVSKVDNVSRPTFGELTNSVSVNYWSSDTGKDASVTIQDTALVQMQGSVINTTVQYPGFTKFDIASRVAQRDLRALSAGLLTCTVYADTSASILNPGDVFKLTWPDYEIDNLIMRVTGLAFGDGKSNTVRITAAQDVFALPVVGAVAEPVAVWVDPVTDAVAADYRAVVEAPYYELVQRLGQTAVDDQLAGNSDIGYLVASAATPGGAINARLAVDAGAGYDGNDSPIDFCPVAFLDADLAPGDTSVAITGGVALSDVVSGTHAQIDGELVVVTSVTDTLLGIGRGVLDTVPVAHLTGATVLFWDDFADSDGVEYVSGETIKAKILPTTGKGTLDLADAPEDSVSFVGRADRPYPPGNLKINGVAYPESIGNVEITWTWAHRDRTQQTSGVIVDTTAGDIGPEVGTTYSLAIYGETDNLLRTVTGLTGTTYTYKFSDELAESGLGSGGTPSLDPGSATGLMHWYRADSLSLSDGDGIASWTDLAPAANHATQGTTTSQPTFKAAVLAGKAVARFDGGDWLWMEELFDLSSSVGAMLIVAKDNGGSSGALLSTRSVANADGWTLRYNSTTSGLYFHTGSSPNVGYSFTDEFHVHMLLRNGLDITTGIDGTLNAPQTISGFSQSTLNNTTIGAENGGTGSLLVGDIAEIIILDNTDSDTINRLVQYLQEEYFGATPSTQRVNGKLRAELKAVRDGIDSYQLHDVTVRRHGYGFDYGYFYGGK